MPPETFEAFCRLGEAAAFVNGDASDAELTDRIDAAEKLLEKVAGRPELCKGLGQAEPVNGSTPSRDRTRAFCWPAR